MAIRNWPEHERPREKLLRQGCHSLSDAELLAVLLGSGCHGTSAVGLGRSLLGHFGGLRPLMSANRQEVCLVTGMGPARYANLQAALELSRRHHLERLQRGPGLSDPTEAGGFLQASLRDLGHELFVCLFLDNRHRVICYEPLFRGTIDGATVHPREVVRQALACDAAAVILAHNHPSGVAEPSDADCRITRRLADALALVDIRVLDHLIVGDGDCVSLAQRGLI
jgi:DNA repair protein RadC